MLFVRISFPYDRIKTALAKVSEQSKAMVVYEHNDKVDNVHVHFLVVDPVISTDTMKNYIRKDVGKVEKTQWSFKKADDTSCITYMSKGKLEPVYCVNVPTDEIARLKALWVSKERSEKRKSDKPTQYELARMVHEACKDSEPVSEGWMSEFKGNQTNHSVETNFKSYARMAIKLHHKYGISFSPYSLERVLCTAMSMEEGAYRETIVQIMLQKTFRGV
jgi:hypothetical protein